MEASGSMKCERCSVYGRDRYATTRQAWRESGDSDHWPDRVTYRCDECAAALRDHAKLVSITITSDAPLATPRGAPREVERRKARTTGTYVVLYDRGRSDPERAEAKEQGYEWLRWETICEEHGSVCSHPTQRLARSFMAAPEEGCEACGELVAVASK